MRTPEKDILTLSSLVSRTTILMQKLTRRNQEINAIALKADCTSMDL
ncbi:hypothetical protein ACQ4M3_15560 [Leptolyngbya sp. AN03gr2]